MGQETHVDPRSLLRHRPFVRAVARRLVADEHAAEDVVQDTWIKALGTSPRPRSLPAWLARVARNLALTARRADRRRGARERAAARPEGVPAAGEAAARLEQHRLVVEAVLALDEPFKAAVLLRFYEDRTPSEIARDLGIPVATARSRLRRGIGRMRAWFDARHGGDRAAWCLALLPLAGLRPVAAGGTTVVAVGGIAVKAELVAAALVLCTITVGVVAWRAGSERPRSSAERASDLAPPVPGVGEGARGERAGPAAGTTTAVEVHPDRGGGAPGAAPGNAGGVGGQAVGRPAAPRPWRLAEPNGHAELGSLRVIVTDALGQALADAKVLVTSPSEGRYETTTHDAGPDGRVEADGLVPGRHTVSATAGDRHRLASQVEIEAGCFTEVTIPFPAGAAVEGVVRHVARGPLPKVKLELRVKEGAFEEWIRATTGEEGRYRLAGVPPGTYPVVLTGEFIGYEPRPRATLVVSGPGTITRDFELGRVALRGVVRDADTGEPIAGVRLQIQGGPWFCEAATDDAGAYAFTDLPEGDHRVSISKDGYGHLFDATGPVPAEGTSTRDYTLRRAAALVLDVRDRDGRPLPGRHFLGVQEEGANSSLGTTVEVDHEGKGRFDRIVPGAYELNLRAKGFLPHAERIEIGPGENVWTVRLEPGGEQGKLALQGTITDSVTGRPVPNASVRIQSPMHAEARTDAQGAYRLHDLPPGPSVLILSRDGYGIRFLRDVEVEKEARTLDFTLDPAATLHLYVTDGANRPVTGQVFLGINGTGEKATNIGTSVETDAEGHGVYRQIVPGTYELRVQKGGTGAAKVEVEITPGENTVRVRLE